MLVISMAVDLDTRLSAANARSSTDPGGPSILMMPLFLLSDVMSKAWVRSKIPYLIRETEGDFAPGEESKIIDRVYRNTDVMELFSPRRRHHEPFEDIHTHVYKS